MKLRVSILALALVLFAGGSVLASTWIIKQDVLQPFSDEKCSFETVLLGADADRVIEGGRDSASNPFGSPQWVVSDEGSSARVMWTGSRVIDGNAPGRFSFAVKGEGPMPRVTDTYWTGCPRGTSEIDIVPGVSVDSIGNPFTGVADVTISNTTNDAIKINNIYYLNRRFMDVEDLNHDILPLGLFQRVDLPADMQLLLDESFTFPVNNSRRTDFLIMKFDVSYDVSSELENVYQGSVEEWFAFRQLDENPSSPHSFDINENLAIEDNEFIKALDAWIAGDISDSLFFAVVDVWVSENVLAVRGFEASNPAVQLEMNSMSASFSLQNAASMAVQIYSLDGALISSQQVSGSSLSWNLRTAANQPVANGVYFYNVTAMGADGQVLSNELKRLVVLR